MPELFTREEVQKVLREAVRDAGGAKKWLRKHKLCQYNLHMIEDGRGATLPGVLEALGFRKVDRYEEVAK